MPHKEFVGLIEENMMILDWLAARLKHAPGPNPRLPRQQLAVLVRLHMGGRAMLKDIAAREMIPAPNLCATFRALERGGLITRRVDDADRRNTWYAVSDAGRATARGAVANARNRVGELFADISEKDEAKLTSAMKTINEILNKMKASHE